jgi:hypothetical protein
MDADLPSEERGTHTISILKGEDPEPAFVVRRILSVVNDISLISALSALEQGGSIFMHESVGHGNEGCSNVAQTYRSPIGARH